MNASHLFEQRRHEGGLPDSSESFWTTLFALFLLHIGKAEQEQGRLGVWLCKKDEPNPPWYVPRKGAPTLNLLGLNFEDISVEPDTLYGWRPHSNLALPADIGGFRPDVLARLRRQRRGDESYLVIENKRWSALSSAQEESYLNLMNFFEESGINAELMLLFPVGCSTKLFNQAQHLQDLLPDRFGVLLWEEVFQRMRAYGWHVSGIDVDGWQKYTDDLGTEVGLV